MGGRRSGPGRSTTSRSRSTRRNCCASWETRPGPRSRPRGGGRAGAGGGGGLAGRGGREAILSRADYFLSRACAEMGVAARKLSAETTEILERHSWPGNVRELENAIGRAVALSEGEES